MDIDKLERFRYVLSLTNETEQDIQSSSRKKHLVKERQMLMYFCRIELGMNLTEIGGYLQRDHSTVIHGIRQFDKILSINDDINNESKRYKYLLKRYHEKFGRLDRKCYICAETLLDIFNADLYNLLSKEDLTPVQNIVTKEKVKQLEKYIQLINNQKNEFIRKMDIGATYSRKTSNSFQPELCNV